MLTRYKTLKLYTYILFVGKIDQYMMVIIRGQTQISNILYLVRLGGYVGGTITTKYIILHHVTSNYVTSYHITSHYLILRHITPQQHQIMSHHITPHHITSCQIILRHVISHHIKPHHSLPFLISSRYVFFLTAHYMILSS